MSITSLNSLLLLNYLNSVRRPLQEPPGSSTEKSPSSSSSSTTTSDPPKKKKLFQPHSLDSDNDTKKMESFYENQQNLYNNVSSLYHHNYHGYPNTFYPEYTSTETTEQNYSSTSSPKLETSNNSSKNSLTPPLSTPSINSSCSSVSETSNEYVSRFNSTQFPFLTSPISQYQTYNTMGYFPPQYNYNFYHPTFDPQHSQFLNLVSNNSDNSYFNSSYLSAPLSNSFESKLTPSSSSTSSVSSASSNIQKSQIGNSTPNSANIKKPSYGNYQAQEKPKCIITPSQMSIEASQRRKRRQRTQFSKFQLSELEKLFQSTRYPDIYVREDLSARIGIPESRIQVWFKNRRSKIRKDEKFNCNDNGNGEYQNWNGNDSSNEDEEY
ncbi:unnamed protein product [Brachionus calyciflorus]|uniref:Homeobox domain-containing protein n=1 Tax=Brachionus calyciflorus TaxID=104777 RepID=A0A813QVB2_9BILA|nr:unnamed protein product [Brachionus calyciflorus]